MIAQTRPVSGARTSLPAVAEPKTLRAPSVSDGSTCPEPRPLSCRIEWVNDRIEWEGEAPAEPHAEPAVPVCSAGSRGSAPAGERFGTIVAESSRRGSAGASPSRENTPSASGAALRAPSVSDGSTCPETRLLNGRTGWEGEAPAEPHAESAGPVCSPGSRGPVPAGERVATIVAESSRRGSAGASPSQKRGPSGSGERPSVSGERLGTPASIVGFGFQPVETGGDVDDDRDVEREGGFHFPAGEGDEVVDGGDGALEDQFVMNLQE